MAVKLGDLLVKAKLVTPEQIQEALKEVQASGMKLGEALVKLGHVSEDDITETLSAQFGVPSINLSHFEIDPNVLKLVAPEVARKYNILPVNKTGATITIAMADPTNVFAMDDIKFMTGYNVEPVVASEIALQLAIDRHYGATHALELKKVMEEMSVVDTADTSLEVVEEDNQETIDLEKLVDEGEEAPVIRLVNIILTDAIKRSASDIHIEPYEREYRVRYRIDGILYEVMNPPPKLKEAIASRIKIKMKLTGRVKELDYRVSVLPTLFGEKIVCRLLDKDNLMLDMTKLGFEKDSLLKFEKAILRPWGMVLVTGPTGSGKTNTLYSALSRINTPETNIMTAEDPVEFNLPGINQVQMKDAIGLNFAAALRSFLRQDPNIILVGEIRDFETAEIAVKAALTGHLVLSTLHTNDAPSTINRLMNMGIEPYLVATSVVLIAAQRLIRRVCAGCKAPTEVAPQVLVSLGFTPEDAKAVQVMKGKGCEKCNNTGYKGRVALVEVLEITEEVRELILSGASSIEIKRKGLEEGMISLRRSGLQKIKEGLTSIEEVVRETVL